jgi:hypothetical protein
MQRYSEWFVSYFLLSWGGTLLLPGNTFDTSHAYQVLGNIMSETGWGVMAFIIGALYLMSCWHGSRMIQKYLLYLALSYWVIVTMSFVVANPIGTANLIYLGLAAHCKLAASGIHRQMTLSKEGADDEQRTIIAAKN